MSNGEGFIEVDAPARVVGHVSSFRFEVRACLRSSRFPRLARRPAWVTHAQAELTEGVDWDRSQRGWIASAMLV